MNTEFLRSPIKYFKARRKAKRIMQKAIRQLVSSGLLKQMHVMSRIG